MSEPYDWLPEAREIAAQCWCDEETSHLVMEPALAEAVARRVAAWMQTGAQHARNEAYWRERALKAEAAQIVPVAHVSVVHMSRYTIEWTNGPLAQGAPLYAAPIVPQGWKLVPVGPTPEMVRAGQELKPLGKWHAQIKAVWTAMLAASPAPDADGVQAACPGQFCDCGAGCLKDASGVLPSDQTKEADRG